MRWVLLLAGLDQQRRHQYRVRRLRARQVAANLLANQRVQQGFEPAALFGFFKDQLAQGGAVQLAVGMQHASTEVLGDARQCRPSRLDHPAGGVVGVHQVDAKVDKVLGCGAFTAADATSEAENPGCCNRSGHLKPTDCK